MASPSSKKRKASQFDSSPSSASNKVAKTIHPFFTPGYKAPVEESSASGSFRWLKSLGSPGSCLHAVNLEPSSSAKVAAFDLDDTIIKGGRKRPELEWEWWNAMGELFFPVMLLLLLIMFHSYAIVVVSNQAGLYGGNKRKNWKTKLGLIAAALPDIPFRLFAATEKDKFRKPMTGMWDELEKLYAEDGIQIGIMPVPRLFPRSLISWIDKTSSFFVGDAAGRNYSKTPGKQPDRASTDRKWAVNVEIPFLTPEEYFLGKAPDPDFTLRGFDASSLPKVPLYTPSSSPLLPNPPTQELVLFVGYPCLGKTTFYRQHFEPAGYLHINQDTLKTRDKCVKAVQEALATGKKCVVAGLEDNTNRDASTRRYYIDVAKKLRCSRPLHTIHGLVSRHAEMFPKLAFTTFKDNFEEPELGEGISQIKKVNWVFNGTPEEHKAWSKWFHLDNKDDKGLSF
ncbi:Bifunctional polynucleotide phosphatase/kinase [Mycena venus]|uniref:Bifunctional polynucleotide phosphatase/kinase n=1 Tax=Mycena venus TaxID=2733690 RepID=A0A8H6XST5_9AGAR|nr:Bifunctional polynucleotide phosphatase/kinase [Mycena venus]